MAEELFSKYNFSLDEFVYISDKKGDFGVTITPKVDNMLRLLVEGFSWVDKGGRKSLFCPKTKISIITTNKKPCQYVLPCLSRNLFDGLVGVQLQITIRDVYARIVVGIVYEHTGDGKWVLKSVFPVEEYSLYSSSDATKFYNADKSFEVSEGTYYFFDIKKIRETDISNLNFSRRTYNCLANAGIRCFADIMDQTLEEFKKIDSLDSGVLAEVKKTMKKHSVSFKRNYEEESKATDKTDNSPASYVRDYARNRRIDGEERIKKGYKIVHEEYGEGVVIALGDYLKVNFPDKPTMRIRRKWAQENCEIIVPEGEQEKYEKGKMDDMRQISDNKLLEVIEEFKKFGLSERSMKEVEQFFRFKIRYTEGHKKALRYNILVRCDNDNEAVRLLETFEEGMKVLGLLPKKAINVTEEQLGSNLPSEFPQKCSLMGIHDCKSIAKDSVAIMSSSIRADIQRERKNKDGLWNDIVKTSSIAPDCTVVAIGPKGFIDYIKEKDDWYYRFFAHRLFLRSMSEAEIMESVYIGIRQEGLTPTKEFKEEIERYVNVVYPKADLRDHAFIDDLLNRIFVNFYSKPYKKSLTKEHVPFYRTPRSFEEISNQLNQLIGLEKVKKEFNNIYQLSIDPFKVNKQRLHFAFVGNPGTGKTTVARLTAEMLYGMGLIKKNKLVTVAPTDIIGVYRGESIQLMQEKIEEAMGGVMFIDEAYFLSSKTDDPNSPQKQVLEVLIQTMENHSDELTVVFAGYEEEIERMLQSNPGLKSRVPYKFVFEDYSDEELLQIFIDIAKREEMSLESGAEEKMLDRIALARTEDNFGNARTVNNIYQQLKVIWLEQEREERVITARDIERSMPIALNADIDKMIGLTSVKQELKALETRVKYIKFLQDKRVTVPKPNLHMLFTGNPGTGKTTVAKKIADCLYQIGMLKTNKLLVVERKDLVGSHVGETAIKTSEVIKKAYNGVLFIDEAYSLYQSNITNDLGQEVIATLITAMENDKDKLVVIFAGYKNEMKVFTGANPGITSRIGFTFHFPDYTPEELTEMFDVKMTKNGFTVSKASLEKVKKLVTYFSQMEDFGNGRFVDKVIDMTINRRAGRSYSRKYNDISEKDIPDINDLIRISIDEQAFVTDEEQSESAKRRTAVHEAGHAIVAHVICPQKKVNRVSINADAGSLGRAVYDRMEDSSTETTMKGELAILFGGRNAERIILGDHSPGCYVDMAQAKRMADHMINDLAMGDLGVTTVMDLLQEADRRATEALTNNKAVLSEIADQLCEKGTILGPDVLKILEGCK